MSAFIGLPTPLSSDSVRPGYIITDPINDSDPSFFYPTPNHQPEVHVKEQNTITQDAADVLVSPKSLSQRKDSVMLVAEESTHMCLAYPQSSFNTLRDNPQTHTFLREAASQYRPLYYITGIQLVKQPPARRNEQHIAEASAGEFRLPTHVRRIASANNTATSGHVVAVQLSKVKCRVGAADEPHALDDLEYAWSYHVLEDGLQLSIGLGRALREDEVMRRDGAGRDDEAGWMDEGWSYSDDDDDSGLGGF